MIFTVLAAVSQLERELIAEGVRNGLANARAKGKHIGGVKKKRFAYDTCFAENGFVVSFYF